MTLPKPAPQDRATSIPLNDVTTALFRRGRDALKRLYLAHNYALNHDGSRWDFAEEIAGLRQSGMMHCDLRWLVSIGYLEHGHETTQVGEKSRKFQRDKCLHFSKNTCFILTELGAAYVREYLIEPPLSECMPPISPELTIAKAPGDCDSNGPTWDRDLQELRVGNTIVKRFKVPAPNQEMILAVFQEENWPVRIDDPLPRHPEIDPKRRLRDTINSLNRNQKKHLIHFHGNGSGEGVRFELVDSDDSN